MVRVWGDQISGWYHTHMSRNGRSNTFNWKGYKTPFCRSGHILTVHYYCVAEHMHPCMCQWVSACMCCFKSLIILTTSKGRVGILCSAAILFVVRVILFSSFFLLQIRQRAWLSDVMYSCSLQLQMQTFELICVCVFFPFLFMFCYGFNHQQLLML